MLTIKTVEPLQGIQWLTRGWRIFMASPANWVLMTLLLGVLVIVLVMIPFLGGIALNLLMPIFMGGMLLAAQGAETGRAVDIMDLFAVFKDEGKRNQLLVVGALMLAGSFLIGILSVPFIGSMFTFNPTGGAPSFHFGFGAFLFILLAGMAMGMLFAYAPALVMFKGLGAVDALKGSFSGALRNIVPFLIFGVIYVVLAVVASIPFGLGFLVLAPVMMGAFYASYEDIFA